jgi:hypothetical protein
MASADSLTVLDRIAAWRRSMRAVMSANAAWAITQAQQLTSG